MMMFEMGEAGIVEGPQPKPSRFQFVPVPGEFTRGRWKCRDFYHPYAETLEFDKNKNKEEANPDKITVCLKLNQPKEVESNTIQVTSIEVGTNVSDQFEETENDSLMITRKNGVTIVRKTSGNVVADLDDYVKVRELSIDDFELSQQQQRANRQSRVPPTPMNTPPATLGQSTPGLANLDCLSAPFVSSATAKPKIFQVQSVIDQSISQPTRKFSHENAALQRSPFTSPFDSLELQETYSATLPANTQKMNQKPRVFHIHAVPETDLQTTVSQDSLHSPTFQVIQTEESKNMSMDSLKNVMGVVEALENSIISPTGVPSSVTITVSPMVDKKENSAPPVMTEHEQKSEAVPITPSSVMHPTAPHSTPYGTPKECQRAPTFDEVFVAPGSASFLPNVSANIVPDVPLAIDNKIEQAMELVKTHLTYAVREEMDMLKASIQELEYQMREMQFECTFLRQRLDSDVVEEAAAYARQQMANYPLPPRRSLSGAGVVLDPIAPPPGSSPCMRNLHTQILQIKQIPSSPLELSKLSSTSDTDSTHE